MATIEAKQTVGQLVAERPQRARIFEQFGLDYCCGGKKPLDAACIEKGLDTAAVLGALAFEDGRPAPANADWLHAPLSDLCDHIVNTHHDYLRRELPRLTELAEKVAKGHGGNHPEMIPVRDTLAEFRAEIEMHAVKEEKILFPLIKVLENSRTRPQMHCGGTVKNPIAVMESEHESAGSALVRMRSLTHDFTPPEDACNTFRVLLAGLSELEADMHQHIHKENNILFPRAVELEAALPIA